jgi:hypothetical protein
MQAYIHLIEIHIMRTTIIFTTDMLHVGGQDFRSLRHRHCCALVKSRQISLCEIKPVASRVVVVVILQSRCCCCGYDTGAGLFRKNCGRGTENSFMKQAVQQMRVLIERGRKRKKNCFRLPCHDDDTRDQSNSNNNNSLSWVPFQRLSLESCRQG